jgi:hypothetical protein
MLWQKPEIMHRFYLLLNMALRSVLLPPTYFKEPEQVVTVTGLQAELPKIRV